MDKRVTLAVAGAGKTYHICHTIRPEQRNLILAYTHENIFNIRNELIDAHGSIPELTTIMTFDSFVYRYFICPYEPTIAEHFGRHDFISKGITTVDPPTRTLNWKGRSIPNPKYKPKDQLEHYITYRAQYYCATLSELVMSVKSGTDALIKRAAARINLFFDQVLIDEFQDFREHDYDLIVTLAKYLNSILLVGDYYQHSVSAVNNSGKPFKKRNTDICYSDYVAALKRARFIVDESSLSKSRRCSENVCAYVSRKLGINIESAGINQGKVIWIKENQLEPILQSPSIVKLVYSDAKSCSFEAINWSYSKGDTVNAACVILTDSFEEMEKPEFSAKGIPTSTINKLYVAMTRTKGDLYLVKASIFRKYKEHHAK